MIDPRHPNYASTPVASDRPRFGYAPADLAQAGRSPIATIVTPFYNVGEVFHETARSVLGQSLQHFEWIIVNDASTTPESAAVLAEYRELAQRDPRVRVIDLQVNGGLSAARNTGFAHARTPYVFLLDADDLIEPTTVEKCWLTLECNPELAFTKGWSVGFAGQRYLWAKGFEAGREFLQENRVTATAMIRTSVHRELGGFDEHIRGGLEDWAFWLAAAEKGHWGRTIPEYLDWYRRRPGQHDDWANMKSQQATQAFAETLRVRCPKIFGGEFPDPVRAFHLPYATLPPAIEFDNAMARPAGGRRVHAVENALGGRLSAATSGLAGGMAGGATKRLMIIMPWFRLGGADKYCLDVMRELQARGWEISVVATLDGHPWLPDFSRLTPDVFMLGHLAGLPDAPRLLRYLINSRRPDAVLISNSELGYLLLPYLRAHCPGPAYLDYVHMEEPHWKNGGHPRFSAGWQPLLDLTITSSQHLKKWKVDRGAPADRIEVCTTNNDPAICKPDQARRAAARRELGLDMTTPVLLYAVRLTDQKQPMIFAESVRLLAERMAGAGVHLRGDKSGLPFVALVAGDGEESGALEAALDQADLRSRRLVRMLGSVPTERMPGLFLASDIFFLPSKWEGIALSMFEAMSAELAVVAADVGGQAELVVPGTGVLIDHTTPAAEQPEVYAKILAELLADPVRRREMGKAARRRIVEHFPLSAMGDRMAELLERARRYSIESPRESPSAGLALELATQAIELTRLHSLAEYLWAYRDQVHAQRRAERQIVERAESELAEIESDRSWRLIVKLRQSAVYRFVARARFGPGWEHGLEHHDPRVKLEKIRSSRSYRVFQGLKAAPPAAVPAITVRRLRLGGGQASSDSVASPINQTTNGQH